jgi:hypothetical protein
MPFLQRTAEQRRYRTAEPDARQLVAVFYRGSSQPRWWHSTVLSEVRHATRVERRRPVLSGRRRIGQASIQRGGQPQATECQPFVNPRDVSAGIRLIDNAPGR